MKAVSWRLFLPKAVVGRDVGRGNPVGGAEATSRVAQRCQANRLHVVGYPQPIFHLLFLTQVGCSDAGAQAQRPSGQEQVLYSQPQRRSIPAPFDGVTLDVGDRPHGVVGANENHGRDFGHVVGQIAG